MTSKPIFQSASREDGFTMIIALGVLFVTSLILAATFVAANGDLGLTRTDTAQKKAYYAALAGVSAYKYHLAAEPNYWKKCPTIANAGNESVYVPGTTDEKYKVVTLPSTEGSSKHTEAECKSGKQSAILQTVGSAIGTFRIESTGTAVEGTKTTTRTLVATFTHPGFINYVYLTNYEILDPAAQNPEPTECAHYYAYRVEHNLTETCGTIEFAPTDKVNGPMHTNDAAAICAEGGSEPVFGRSKEDKVEMNGGHYGAGGSCSNSPKILGEYTEKGPTLTPPESDSELIEAAESGYKLKGRTYLELKTGTPNTISVTNNKGEKLASKNFPPNGLIYVENEGSCPIKYSPYGTNYTGDTACGNVYVKGEYTESLTIAAANDLIVNGSLTTAHEASGKPTGSATLGLIATNFVRVYHPVAKEYSVKSYTPKTATPINKKCVKEVKLSGSITNSSTEVTGLSSTGELAAGAEVTGSGIPAGDTIKSIKSSSIIVLNKKATKTETTTLTFYVPTGYEYYSGIEKCVEKGESGYTYHESENLFAESCNGSDTYAGGGKCAYQNSSSGCDAANAEGTFEPTIDAAILSTAHSFIVDNFKCGAHIGNLNVWGSIAQFWRGPVGTGGGGGTGFTKNYNYDDRLQTLQPPDFLAPTSSSLKLSRLTEVKTGYTG